MSDIATTSAADDHWDGSAIKGGFVPICGGDVMKTSDDVSAMLRLKALGWG